MLDFELPELTKKQAPAFISLETCRSWLDKQPLANPAQTQAALLAQLNLLNRYAIPVGERLKILELMRAPIDFVQNQLTRKFYGRPLPLDETEQAVFDANRALWQALCMGFQHCLAACCMTDEATPKGQAALIGQRALSTLAAEQRDLLGAAHEPDTTYWRRLNSIYAAAEKLGVTEEAVADPMQPERSDLSVRTEYIHPILMHAASPYELTARQVSFTQRWLQRWGVKVRLLTTAPDDFSDTPLGIDIAADRPASTAPEAAKTLRWIEVSGLAHSLKKRIVALQRGAAPATLQLGEDCAQPGCEALLKHILQHACKGGLSRAENRHPRPGSSRAVSGFQAIHYYISGAAFQQPLQAQELSQKHYDELATFGHIATRVADDYSKQQGYQVEEWQLIDHSANGLQLCRPLRQQGARIGVGSLLAVCPAGAPDFLLAAARWVMISNKEQLHIGVMVFPGAPKPLAAHCVGLSADREKFQPAFLLPAVPALQQAATVIVPASWYRAGRIIELYDEKLVPLRLTRLLQRGSDFERAEFENV